VFSALAEVLSDGGIIPAVGYQKKPRFANGALFGCLF